MAPDVFLSHSTSDARLALTTRDALNEAGVTCWVAPHDIPKGAIWSTAISEAIATSRALIVLLSSHANSSLEIVREVNNAASQRKGLLTVRLENINPAGGLEYFLSATQWLDAFPPPLEQHLDDLVAAVRAVLEIEAPAPPPKAPEPPFVEVDLDDFGRRVPLVDRWFRDR